MPWWMLDNPFGEEICPNIQPKPPLVQLQAAIASCSTTYYLTFKNYFPNQQATHHFYITKCLTPHPARTEVVLRSCRQ